jgi:two-component system KDP operon response regulator KdpE
MEETKKVVLIAEDEESLLNALSDKLESENFNIVKAKTGPEAVDKFKESKADIILLDLLIPEKNGVEVLKEVRNTELGEKTRVIVFSNMNSFDYVSKCLEYNATEYFVKADTSLDQIVSLIKGN